MRGLDRKPIHKLNPNDGEMTTMATDTKKTKKEGGELANRLLLKKLHKRLGKLTPDQIDDMEALDNFPWEFSQQELGRLEAHIVADEKARVREANYSQYKEVVEKCLHEFHETRWEREFFNPIHWTLFYNAKTCRFRVTRDGDGDIPNHRYPTVLVSDGWGGCEDAFEDHGELEIIRDRLVWQLATKRGYEEWDQD